MIHPTLYQIDSKGKARFWRMETDGGKHRTISGLIDGKEVTSGWVIVEAKNEGRANATTVEQQALSEVKSLYTKKQEQKYHASLDEASSAGTGMKFLQPMLAYKWPDFTDKFTDSHMFFTQPKLDGIRCTVSASGMLSRAGKPIVACPHILEALGEFFRQYPDVVLDGELYNHELKHDFDKITSLVKRLKPTAEDLAESDKLIQYHVYDVASMNGFFRERNQFITDTLDQIWCIKHVETHHVTKAGLDDLYAKWLEAGYEGQMIRRDMVYENKRSKSLLKRKEFLDEEFPIVRVETGLGNWDGCAKRAVCSLPDGRTFEAGVRGKMEFLRDLLNKANAGSPPKTATVRFQNYTPDGIPRFGVVVQWDREL